MEAAEAPRAAGLNHQSSISQSSIDLADELTDPVFDAFLAAAGRGEMPTGLDTAGLRELSAELRTRMVFTARGTSAAFVSRIKAVIDLLAAGDIGPADARPALTETLRALGYSPDGGFPDAPAGSVPPALEGTLQYLSSFRRLDLIVRTQLELMQGAGQQARGQTPDRLEAAPAWELIRVLDVKDARDWPARWAIAGGKPIPDSYPANAHQYLGKETGMIALKGDPVWGELGASGNFSDALDVDHPPFAFNSGMGWREVQREEAIALGITGPDGESIDDWLAGRPATMAGPMELPTPSLSMKDVDPEIADIFVKETLATSKPGRPGVYDYSALLREELAKADASYGKEDPR